MSLQGADIQRFEWLKSQVTALGIRFPVADIAKKTGFDEGNVSSYLKGKKPISDNFLTKFKEAYKIGEDGQPSAMQILAVLAEAFRDQAALMKNIESKMAREDTQAMIEKEVKGLATNLNVAQADIEKISLVQDRTEKVLNYLAELTAGKNQPSKGSDKQKHGIHGDGRKQGKSPA